MKEDLKEPIIKECLKDKDDFSYFKGPIEKFPYKLIKDNNWNKDIFNW